MTRSARRALSLALVLPFLGGAEAVLAPTAPSADASTGTTTTTASALPGTSGPVRTSRLTAPARTVLQDDLGVVATFTDGSRTVTLRGATRVFRESTTTATVTTDTWVRLLDAPFAGTVPDAWLSARLADTSPDVLAVAMQYTTGAPAVTDAGGLRIAGDASYGPLQADGTRQEGSDFNDYLGVTWTYDGTSDRPEAEQLGALDCSGFLRMVLGYRSGVPLTLSPDGVRLPRRAVQMLDSAPGTVTIPNTGVRPTDLSSLTAGDLLFFDAATDDGTLVDHVALYLGRDSAGAPRFVSSRKTVDGPTMGDTGGRSTLSGTGLYAKTLRAVRRL